MPLIDLKTNLKDLKYGHDEQGGASSNEPYVVAKIPGTNEPLQTGIFAPNNSGGIRLALPNAGTGGTDFLLRGGLLLPDKIIDDEKRLLGFFKDIKGTLFAVKQNLLSRIAVNTQASPFLLNEGVYTPISTLLEAAGLPFGLHVNKQGLNPLGGFLGLTTYSEVLKNEINSGDPFDNRLSVLYGTKIVPTDNNDISFLSIEKFKIPYSDSSPNVLRYGGGPDSILGIGKTNIRFADQRTGVNNPDYSLEEGTGDRFFGYYQQKNLDTYLYRGEIRYVSSDLEENIQRFLGASGMYGITRYTPYTNTSLASVISETNTNDSNPGLLDLTNNNTATFTPELIQDIPTSILDDGSSFLIGGTYIGGAPINASTPGAHMSFTVGDFRRNLRDSLITSDVGKTYLVKAPNYKEANLEKRVNIGYPGALTGKEIQSYTAGVGVRNSDPRVYGAASVDSYDKINAIPIYNGDKSSLKEDTNDFVHFRIGVIDNDNPITKTYIHFRAFLDTISDTYNSNWDPTRYIGRGENLYTYAGFDRKVSLSWTVAAQSKAELIPMYKRLNYLASICAPDYNKNGYMRGNIVTLTVGGYFYEQPGIITGLSYEMNDENDTWEIGISDSDLGGGDASVKELPHIIRVKGFNFIPIHNFVPRKQRFDGSVTDSTQGLGPAKYGPERFIALEDKEGVNKSGYGPIYIPQ